MLYYVGPSRKFQDDEAPKSADTTYQILSTLLCIFLDDLLCQAFNVVLHGVHFNVFVCAPFQRLRFWIIDAMLDYWLYSLTVYKACR